MKQANQSGENPGTSIHLLPWQPIETAPRDGSDFLAFLRGMMVVVFYENNPIHPWQTADGIGYHKDAPTHWLPLPEPPK
jgi:hypothetical protein